MFTLLCCADLHGEKVNLEITLDAAPVSVQDLVGSLTHIFAREEAALLARQGYTSATPAFQISSAFIYDDVLLQWTRLKSITQLHEYDQLYVFQPQTQWHRDTQQDLPPPRPPVQSRATSIAAAASGSGGGGGAVTPLPTSSRLENAAAQSRATMPPSVTLQSGPTMDARLTPAHYAASPLSESSGVAAASRSPLRSQLEEQRREEERLSQRLSSVRNERERLEREAQREEEEERRRRGAELDERIRKKEQEIWAHRDALARAEDEFQRLLAEKKRLMGSVSPH
jgi:hypothetical protein